MKSSLKLCKTLNRHNCRALKQELNLSQNLSSNCKIVRKSHMNNLFRVLEISISNYKGISKFHLQFPSICLPGDADICVIGSKNGIGKTSLLECCAILVIAAKGQFRFRSEFRTRFRETMNVVRGEAKEAIIEGVILEKEGERRVKVTISKDGRFSVTPKNPQENRLGEGCALNVILGEYPEPVISPRLLYIHGYRKIKESNPDLGLIARSENDLEKDERYVFINRREPASVFKHKIIMHLMTDAGLFGETKEPQRSMEIFESLLMKYANVKYDRLLPHVDSTMDIMVKNEDLSFPFDSLSSGQKEMISTLFLIWETTKKEPYVVLIDEPELHLNSQWHGMFIKSLVELAPKNQYIIATHSEHIVRKIESERRIFLYQ